MKKIALLVSFLVIVLVLTACPDTTTPALKATINSFTATPPSLPAGGGSITLNWDVKDATKLSIDASVGEVTGNSKTVSVTSSKTFTLTAESAGGSVTKTTEVTVQGGADITPPTVVLSTPTNSAAGVAKDASIVITFSEKMDQLATQGAYQSADLPASAVTFNWDAEGTLLTIKPNTSLTYATGISLSIAAKGYAFSISSTAKDVAGNALAPFSSSFTTLKAIYTDFIGEKVRDGTLMQSGFVGTSDVTLLVGDNAANSAMRGFLSFDLAFISGDAVGIESARLNLYKQTSHGDPYIALEDCPVPCVTGAEVALTHVNYGDGLTAKDFDSPSLADLGSIDNRFKSFSTLFMDVTTALQDDLVNRATRGNRSQYRLSFPVATNNDSLEDDVNFVTADSATNPPLLVVTYLIP